MSNNDEIQQILSSIFILDNKSNPKFPILISPKDISKLIIYLKDTNKPLDQKLDLLTTILGFFQFNENLINVFMRPIYYNSQFFVEFSFFLPNRTFSFSSNLIHCDTLYSLSSKLLF